MKKEKTYKTWQEALKYQNKGEACVFDKDKKAYVNIRDWPRFKNPFEYDYNAGIIISLIGAMFGSFWGPLGVSLGGFSLPILHYLFHWLRFR